MTDIAGDIVGTWRLVGTKAHDDAGKPLPPPYGPTPTGVGHIPSRRTHADRAVRRPGDFAARRAAPIRVLRRQLRFDGSTLVTRVDASSDASRVGGEQVRQVRFEGTRLVLNPPRRLWSGVMQHQELVWERVV